MEHIRNIQAALAGKGLDALLLTDPISCRYATGFFFTDGAVLVARDRAWLLTDSRYTEAAAQKVTEAQVTQFTAKHNLQALCAELCAGIAGPLGAEETRVSHSSWTGWEKALSRTLTPAAEILSTLRASKDEGERESLIAAQRIAERALNDVLGLLRPGLTEREVAAELTYRMMKYGGEGNSFDPIAVAGTKTSMPHGVPGDNIIRTGDFVTLDFGTLKNGYCSDMTRTVVVGKASSEMKKIYHIVLEAQLAGIAAARSGIPGRAIDAAARKVIEDAGYGQYFGHGFGHSLGLEIHEAPNASPSCETVMPEGAVVSAEPGIYLPGRYGARIEDVMILTAAGAQVITKAPKELLEL